MVKGTLTVSEIGFPFLWCMNATQLLLRTQDVGSGSYSFQSRQRENRREDIGERRPSSVADEERHRHGQVVVCVRGDDAYE